MEEYSMKDLTPDRDYMFRIRAETPEGDVSEPTHPIPYYRSRESSSYERSPVPEYKPREQDYSVPTRTYVDHLTTFIPPRLPIDKPELYEAGPDSATLSWKPAKVPERIRNKTSLTYSIDVRTPPNHEWRELVSGLTSTSYSLTNLHPRLDYMFRVKAHNDYGCSEASLPASLFRPIEIEDEDLEYEDDDWDDEYRGTLSETVPPKLPMETPRITDHGETAMLHWHEARIPVYAKKTPITYIIEIKEPPIPGWSRFASGISDTNYFIENLLSNHDYQFRVRAETQFGVSDPTLPAVLDRTREQVKESIEEFDYTIEDFVIKGSQKKEEKRRQSISCLAQGEKVSYYQLKKMLSSISPNSSSQSSHDSLNHRHTSESGTYNRISQPLYLPSDDDSDDDMDDVRGGKRYTKNRKSYQSSSESHSLSRRTRHGYRAAERSQNVDMEDYESRVKTLYDSNRERIEKAHKLLREDATSPTRSFTSSYDAGRSVQSRSDTSAAEDRYSLRKSYASLQAASFKTQRKTDEGISLITKTSNTSLSEDCPGRISASSVDNEIGSYSPLLRKANVLDTSEISSKSSRKDNSISKSKSRPYTYLLSSSDEDEKLTNFKSKDSTVNTSRGVSSDLYSQRSFTYLLSSSDEDDSDEREAKRQRLQIEKERKLASEKLQNLTEMLLLSDSDEKQSLEMRIQQKSKMSKYASFSESKITTDVEEGRQLFQTEGTTSGSCQSKTTGIQQCEIKSKSLGEDLKKEIDETLCFGTRTKTSEGCEVNIDRTRREESEEDERGSDQFWAEGCEVKVEENQCCEMENKISQTEGYGVKVEERQHCESDNDLSRVENCELKFEDIRSCEVDRISRTEGCVVKDEENQSNGTDSKISGTGNFELKVQETRCSEMKLKYSETEGCEVKVEGSKCCGMDNKISETEGCEVKVEGRQCCEMDNKISETEGCDIKVKESQCSEMKFKVSETEGCEVKVEGSKCCGKDNKISEIEGCEVKVEGRQCCEIDNKISETEHGEVKVEGSQCCGIDKKSCGVKVEGLSHCCETDNDMSRAKCCELKLTYEKYKMSGTEGCVVKVEGKQGCEMSKIDSCEVEVEESWCNERNNKIFGTKNFEVKVEGSQCCEKDAERSIIEGCEVKVEEKHCHQTEIKISEIEKFEDKVEGSLCCENICEGDSQISQSRLYKNVAKDYSPTSTGAAQAEISNEFRQFTFLSSSDTNSGPKTCNDEQSRYKDKLVTVDKSKQFSYLLSSSDEDESVDIPRRPSLFDQYSHLLLSSDSDEEGLTSKGRKENRPYRSFLQDKAIYEKMSRSRTSQIDSTSGQYGEASETNMPLQRRSRSIRRLSSKQNSQTTTSKQTTCEQNGNFESESKTGKTRRPSLDKKSDLDLPQTVYLESLVTGVPPRMSSSRPLITNQIGSHLTLSWLPGRVPSYVKGSHMSYIVEVRQPPSYQWNVLVDDLEECEFDVYDLLPDQDYMFRIRARNEFGMSDPTMPASVIRSRDDYTGPTHTSRSASRDSLGSPWMRSRASSTDSVTKQWSFDEDYDVHPIRNAAPEFRPSEDTFYGAQSRPMRINLQVRGFPLPNITWSHKGKKLGKRYKSYITPSGHVTLEIPEVTEDNVGEYKCCAENEEGVAVRKFTLELADPPTFLEPMKDIVVDMRGGGKFECRIDGIPYPSVKWMKDWRPLAESSRIHVRHVAPDYWCLELGGAIGLDAGLYTCVAENPAGKAVSSAQLTIEDRPPKPMGLHFRQSRVEDYYYILEELGRGRHGVVRRVIDKSSGREFAAKFIPVSDPHHKYFFRQELENLRGVSHKNILEVTDAFQSNWGLVIISELVNGGELLDRVLSMENWMESDVAHYIHQVLKAIKHLHGTGVLHLDIKPSNIHLNNSVSDEIKLIDFGLSRRLYPEMVIKHNYGTTDYTSPEQINNDPLTHAADIWSTGTLAYLLLSGISPFHAESDRETLRRVQSCDWCFDDDAFKSVSKEAKDFISKLLVLDPSERLTIDECLEHAWIKNSSTRGQGASLNLDRLGTFHDAELKQRRQGYLQRCARIQSLQSILKGESEPDPILHPFKDSTTGNLTFPDSDVFGKFLDEESWADWQTRNHQGGDTVLAPLTDADYTSRIKGYKSATSGESDTSGTEEMMKERCDLFDLEKEHVTFDPSHEIEAEWLVVAEDFKQRTSAKELFPAAEQDSTAGPLFTSKLQNQTYMPGDTITLSCRVTGHNANVSWYRNEEPVSDGSRLRTVFSEDGKATLTIQSSKPYDEGLYKCVARNREGRTTTWARVQVGGVSEQPGRPAVTEVSSSEVLLVWEPPVSLGNTYMLGYRVDYRLAGRERWQTAAYIIDECCLVSDLLPGKTYRFRVCCYNQYGYSPYSYASHEVKTLSSGGSIQLDSYTEALLARQRDVDRHPTPPTSREGSEPSPQFVKILESSLDSSYDVLNSVYSGGFADLKCCKMPESSALYLAKIIPATDSATYRREYDILHTLQHERIVGLYGTYLYKERLCLILEFLYGLNVAQHFAYKTRYTEDMVAYVIRQILDGVQYLHYVGVTHLNLQPSSIVMVSRRRSDIKIVDFSLARILQRTGELIPRQGNPEFMAPEVVTREMTSKSADIWTIGTLAFLLLSGVSPFEGETEEKIFSNIAYNRYRAHSLYENVTREALKFVFQVLKRTPRRRLTVDQCLEDKWLHLTEVMSKARQEKVFTTISLRNFTRRYFKKRVLQMYPIIEQEVTSSVATDDMEDLEEPSIEKEGTSQPIKSENTYEPGEAQLEEMASTLVTTAIDAALHSPDIKSA